MSGTVTMGSARDLSGVFAPRSVALIGASGDPDRLTGRPLTILRKHGFPGEIYPVNPKYTELEGQVCYPDVASIPAPVDLALVMLPAHMVPDAVRSCGEADIRNVVIISSGFEETDGGRVLGEELASVAEEYGINLVGPNSEGIWSVPHRTILTFGSAALHNDIHDGPVSVLSQSGSIGGATVVNLQKRGVGCRYFISLGNETVLGALDYLEYLVAEGGSRVIVSFVEGLNDAGRLRQVALDAAAADIDLVILKGAQSEAGRVASASHTGKIATSQAIYSSIFEQCGIITVDTINELTEAASVLVTAKLPDTPPPVDQPGVGVVAPGGSRVLMSDEATRRQVPLAVFSPDTVAALSEVIPSYGAVDNPVDATAQVLSAEDMFERALNAISGDPAVEGLLLQFGNRGLQRIDELRAAIADPANVPTEMPTVVGFLGEANALSPEAIATFRDAGIVAVMGPEVTVKYMSWLYRSRDARLRAREIAAHDVSTAPHTRSPLVLDRWTTQMQFLEMAGIATPPWTVVERGQSLDSVRLPAFPVAAKALSEDVDHKSDQGLVRLGLADTDELAAAVDDLLAYGDGALRGVLVQGMAHPGHEVLATVMTDPDFGPVLSFGSGGTLVELLDDLVHVAIPCTDVEIRRALERTMLAKVLRGVRGAPPADTDALVSALVGLSRAYLALDAPPDLIELNPLLVGAVGEGVVALDVLVT